MITEKQHCVIEDCKGTAREYTNSENNGYCMVHAKLAARRRSVECYESLIDKQYEKYRSLKLREGLYYVACTEGYWTTVAKTKEQAIADGRGIFKCYFEDGYYKE